MSRFRELSRSDFIVLILSLALVGTVFTASAIHVYLGNKEQTASFKVFDVYVDYWPDIQENQTQVLTYGAGKYYFIGTWDKQFLPEHSYKVTYVQKTGAARKWQNLIIIDLEEIG